MTWLGHLKNLLPINVQKRLKFLHRGVPSFFKSHFKKPENITLENYLKDKKFFVFSFVRHPFDRLVSAYLDKTAGKPVSVSNFTVKIFRESNLQYNSIFAIQDYPWEDVRSVSAVSTKVPHYTEWPAWSRFLPTNFERLQ